MAKAVSAQTGVIITSPFSHLDTGTLNLSFAQADAKLLFFMTYFSQVAVAPFNYRIPSTTSVLTSTELEQQLAEQGLIRTCIYKRIEQGGAFDVDFVSSMAENAYLESNSAGDGRVWALAPTSEMAEHYAMGDLNCIVATIEQSLPCPRADVPISDVIAFRQENEADLVRLYDALNSTFFRLRGGGLSATEANQMLAREVTDSIKAVQAAFKRFKIPFFTPDLAISYSIPKIAVAAVAELLGHAVGLPLGYAGGAASAITFNLGKSKLGREDNKSPKDFQYVLSGLERGILAQGILAKPPVEYDLLNINLHGISIPGFYPQNVVAPPRMRDAYIRDVIFM